RHAWGALAAAALVSVPLSGQPHLALGVIPFVAVYAALRFAPTAAAWTAGGLLAAVGVGLAVHLTIVRGSAESGGRSLQEVGEFSAEWADLLSRWQLDGLEEFVYVGWLLPLLAAAGAVLLWRAGTRVLALLLGAAALVPAVLALGTNLPLYEWLWDVFPPLRYPRVPGRLLPIANLALAALAAVAVARLLAASGRRAALTAGVLTALVAADLLVFPLAASDADEGNRAYAALAEEPDGRILELPLFEPGIHYGSVYDAYQLQAARERPGGYSTLVPQPAFDFFFQRNRLSCGIWLPGDEELLRESGVEHVLFHRGMYEQGDVPGAYFGWLGLLEHGFAPVAQDGPVTLLTRAGAGSAEAPALEPNRDEPFLCEGWDDRTMRERQGPLWLYGDGPVQLDVTAAAETPASLWLNGRRVDETVVSGPANLSGTLEGGWNAVVLEVPALIAGNPPNGLRLERIAVSGLR
ncbi:MAG: hypothetical protein ACRDNI_09745, partial [Gaiellaceae bacterium]